QAQFPLSSNPTKQKRKLFAQRKASINSKTSIFIRCCTQNGGAHHRKSRKCRQFFWRAGNNNARDQQIVSRHSRRTLTSNHSVYPLGIFLKIAFFIPQPVQLPDKHIRRLRHITPTEKAVR